MLSKGCPRCGGDIFSAPDFLDGPEYKCLQCGYSMPEKCYREEAAKRRAGSAPPAPVVKEVKMKQVKLKERILALEKNRDAIVADYQIMTLKGFLKKWRIHTNLWQKLKLEWGVASKQKHTVSREPVWDTHHVGKKTRYDLKGGVYSIAPLYQEQFDETAHEQKGIDDMLAMVTRHAADDLKRLSEKRQRIWDALQDDIGLDKSVNWRYNSGEVREGKGDEPNG